MPEGQPWPTPARSRWLYTSQFAWVAVPHRAQPPILPTPFVLFGSGRDALRALVAWGAQRRGWRRWWVPSYYCQEVPAAIGAAGAEVLFYQDSPLRPRPLLPETPARRGDVVLVVNYFGLRGREALRAMAPGRAAIVEDHTHDPWSRWACESQADYCLVSLRKTLPLPDGGALWSPQGHALPAQPPLTPQRLAASWSRLAAMILQRLYLEGHAVDRRALGRLQTDGEDRIASGPVSGPTRFVQRWLPALPWQTWRGQRAANYRQLRDAVAHLPGVRVVGDATDNGSCPFALVLRCDHFALRQRLRARLIAQRVYATVLWPIADGGVPLLGEAAQLARELLVLPCDFQYGTADLRRVAEAMRQALAEIG